MHPGESEEQEGTSVGNPPGTAGGTAPVAPGEETKSDEQEGTSVGNPPGATDDPLHPGSGS